MERSTIIAGFGGQGLLFAGHVLAQAAMLEGLTTSWMPSYGPEMRGGTASCTVIVADRPIGSPIVDVVDGLVALNAPSLARFAPMLRRGGVLVVDASLIELAAPYDRVETVALPLTSLAGEAGDDRLVSIVALGALLSRRPFVQPGSIRAAIADLLGVGQEGLAAADLRAFQIGLERGRPRPMSARASIGAAQGSADVDAQAGCLSGQGRSPSTSGQLRMRPSADRKEPSSRGTQSTSGSM
jgi:2-oxoglutarate ferredoxin oxidoreductase subunit gamma